MDAVAEFAAAGGPVVGICNGFQVLTEAGLLPGALQKNVGLTFVCDTVELRVETTRTALTNQATVGEELRIPINHFEGNYVCSARDPRRAARRGPRRGALRGEPQRQPRRHRGASATRRATWWASCRTPSAPATCCSAATTAWSCCAACSPPPTSRPAPAA